MKRLTSQGTWRQSTVDKEQAEKEISTLEEKIEKLRASKPAHDVTGAYVMELLELEDDLQAKKKNLQQVRA